MNKYLFNEEKVSNLGQRTRQTIEERKSNVND